MMKIGKVMKFVRKGHKVGRIRKDGMEESGGCLWAGIFGTESDENHFSFSSKLF